MNRASAIYCVTTGSFKRSAFSINELENDTVCAKRLYMASVKSLLAVQYIPCRSCNPASPHATTALSVVNSFKLNNILENCENPSSILPKSG